jgi:ech hydrogenase subunit D
MMPDTIIEPLERDALPAKASELFGEGYRLVQMMGTARPDDIEVMVSFNKADDLKNFRIMVPRTDLTLPSISGTIIGAISYENELQDLFGIKVNGIAIDYGGNFLRTKQEHPLAAMAEPQKPAGRAAKKREKAGNQDPGNQDRHGLRCEM